MLGRKAVGVRVAVGVMYMGRCAASCLLLRWHMSGKALGLALPTDIYTLSLTQAVQGVVVLATLTLVRVVAVAAVVGTCTIIQVSAHDCGGNTSVEVIGG